MASVATFDDTMVDIVYELDDREIHNDIRSETRVSDVVVVADSEDEYTWVSNHLSAYLKKGESEDRTTQVSSGREALDWAFTIKGATTGPPDYFDYSDFTATILSSDDSSCTVRFTNTGSQYCHAFCHIAYKYLVSEGTSHEETQWSTLTVRVTDPTSILKYGRRVLNLTWPLGATQNQTQSIAESYRDKHSEPVSRITMLVKGKTDALKVQILTREISELITVISSELGLNADYYINRIDYKEFTDSLPQVTWTLEEQRASEAAGIFLLDTSDLDGITWIG